MSDQNRIEVGDFVRVNMDAMGMNFIHGEAEVLYIPQHPHEEWQFKSSTGDIIWTSEPITIRLTRKSGTTRGE